MTTGNHKSKDNDAIFEAYAQQQLDERGGFWDKQLARSPVMKKVAGNLSSAAQGRVNSAETAKQITQAFASTLGRNHMKGMIGRMAGKEKTPVIDTNQFKNWMFQATGVDPKEVPALGNLSQPKLSISQIRELIPNVVDVAIDRKQSGPALPGVAGMSQNTQVAAPQQQTATPPAGVTPPNPNSQPQQAAVNNPNTPEAQANVQASPETNTATNVAGASSPGLFKNIYDKISAPVRNLNQQGQADAQKAIDANNAAKQAAADKQAAIDKQQNQYDAVMTKPVNPQDQYDAIMSEPPVDDQQTAEPPSMQDLAKTNVDNGNEVVSTPVATDDDVEEVEAEPIEAGETEPSTGDGVQTNVIDVGDQNPAQTKNEIKPTVVTPPAPNAQSTPQTPNNQKQLPNKQKQLPLKEQHNNILGGCGFMSNKWGKF